MKTKKIEKPNHTPGQSDFDPEACDRYCRLLSRAVREGRIASPDRIAVISPILEEINAEIDETERKARRYLEARLFHALARESNTNLSEPPRRAYRRVLRRNRLWVARNCPAESFRVSANARQC
ncbi:MAG: hypothetical protein ACREEM_24760 [Blastocatellia bacterium]